MLPFPIMSKYGNSIPRIQGVKKYVSMFNGLVVLDTVGNLYAIGQNDSGQLGLGDTNPITNWTLINTNVSDFWCDNIVTTLVRKNNSQWEYTGRAYFMGLSTTVTTFTDCTSFMASFDSTFRYINLCYNMYLIDNNDNLYVSGFNASGSLGTGATTRVTALTASLTNVNTVVATQDSSSTAVLKTDGTLWTCGSGANNQLGYTVSTNQLTFKQVSISNIVDVKMGYLSMYVLCTDGLYTCGTQFSGQLGNSQNNNNNKSLGRITISAGVPSKIYANRYNTVMKIGTSWYYTGQSVVGGNTVSTVTLIPSAYIADVGPDESTIQNGYMKLYALVNGNLYGSGNYNAGGYANLLPYYDANVIGLKILTTTIGGS